MDMALTAVRGPNYPGGGSEGNNAYAGHICTKACEEQESAASQALDNSGVLVTRTEVLPFWERGREGREEISDNGHFRGGMRGGMCVRVSSGREDGQLGTRISMMVGVMTVRRMNPPLEKRTRG